MSKNSLIKTAFSIITSVSLLAVFLVVRAETMPSSSTPIDVHTIADQAAGQVVWQKFQAKTLTCSIMNDENFRVLGEYYMSLIIGEKHAAYNGLIMQTIGVNGEAALHAAMGKRLSGCDTSAPYPKFSPPLLGIMQNPTISGQKVGNVTNYGCNYLNSLDFNSWYWSLGWILLVLILLFAAIGLISVARYFIHRRQKLPQ